MSWHYWRGGKPIEDEYAGLSLQFGDALLVQFLTIQIQNLKKSEDLVVLEEDPDAVLMPRKGLLTIIITLVTLTIAALGVLPVALRPGWCGTAHPHRQCRSQRRLQENIEWKAIFLIAGLWPLSIALQETGLAEIAVTGILNFIETPLPSRW